MWLTRRHLSFRSTTIFIIPLWLLSACGSGNDVDVVEAQAGTTLTHSKLGAGYVSLSWTASLGDVIQDQPGDDAVSYYRIFRNGEPFIDAFSTAVEDTNPPQGEVTYSIQAVKFVTTPEFSLLESDFVELKVIIPSFDTERINLAGELIDSEIFTENLNTVKSCAIAHELQDGSSLCVNQFGDAWPVARSGEAEALFPHTSGVAAGMKVSVHNREADFGPVPGLPEWSVTLIPTGETLLRSLPLDSVVENNERYLVNGVAVSEEGSVYISGTIYQSFLPRSLGPTPGILPVTNAHYVAELNSSSGELIRFKRFTLAQPVGIVANVSNGVLEMYQSGQVILVDTQTLTILDTLRVSGMPIFSNEVHVYTQVDNETIDTQFYRFSR